MVLYTAADLIWATRIKAAADDVGVAARPVRSTEMLAARLADASPDALLVDLEADSAIDIIRMAAHARDQTARPRYILAFGPHADTERLQAAADAGADRVMPRGALAGTLPRVLAQLDARPEAET